MIRAALLLVFLAACGKEPTQVMVTVEAEDGVRSMTDSLEVHIDSVVDSEVTPAGELRVPHDDLDWPLVFALAPRNGDARRGYRFEAVARGVGDPPPFIARVAARSEFVEGRVLWLELILADACIGVDGCGSDQTCNATSGTCNPDFVEAASLPDAPRRFDRREPGDAGTGDAGVPGETLVEIDAGFTHTCVRRARGEVLCWGAGELGMIGDGARVVRSRATAPTGLADAIALGSGVYHTCAVRRDGTTACWGANMFGELGDGTTMLQGAPVASPLRDLLEITGGSSFTCAVRTGDRSVACWGAGTSGQLGNGSTMDSLTPLEVQDLLGVVQIDAGTDFACAIGAAGGVSCWGQNEFGQLGIGSHDGGRSVPTPLTLTGPVQVAGGERFACARLDSGAVRCWGRDGEGQLGDGLTFHEACATSSCSDSPVAVDGLTDAVDLAAGTWHACAVRATGNVVCWGKNDRGQLGGSAPDLCAMTSCSSRPVPVPGIGDAVRVAAGGWHTCVVRRSNRVTCWGDNANGQLGNGTTDPAGPPQDVLGL